MAVLRIGEPRRHLLRHHGGLHRLGPRARFRVSQQRHRSHFARAVAFLAVLLQDRQNVLVKCDARSGHRGHSRETAYQRKRKCGHPFTSWQAESRPAPIVAQLETPMAGAPQAAAACGLEDNDVPEPGSQIELMRRLRFVQEIAPDQPTRGRLVLPGKSDVMLPILVFASSSYWLPAGRRSVIVP